MSGKKANVCIARDDGKARRGAAQAAGAVRVPFGGQWRSKAEMPGIQRALQSLLSSVQLDIHIHTGKSAVRRTAGTARSLSHQSETSVTAFDSVSSKQKKDFFFFFLNL